MNKFLIAITVTLFLGSCGGGNSSSKIPVAVAPSLSLEASDTEQLVDDSITLAWSSSNATSCSASGAWSGSKNTSGSESIVVASAGQLTYSLECSGAGGSASSSATITGYQEFLGVSVDGYIRSADIFIDENDNFEADGNELATVSADDGSFQLRYTVGNLVSLGGFDVDSGNLLDKLLLVNKLDNYNTFAAITPITTIISFMESPENIHASLGIDASLDIGRTDPVKNVGDGGIYDYLYEKGNQATILVLALQNIANNLKETQDSSQDYFKAFTEVLEASYADSESKVDVESNVFITTVLDKVVTSQALEISDDDKSNTALALSALLPLIEVKSDEAINVALFNFATSTLQTDIKTIANGTATPETLNIYATDLINYVATDQNVSSGELTPNIIATADSASTNEDVAIEISVLTNDSYTSASPISVTVGTPSDGVANFAAGVVFYTPSADFFGADSFEYTISQSDKSASAIVTVSIAPVNDAPAFNNLLSQYSVAKNQLNITTVLVVDTEGDETSISIGGVDAASFELSNDNLLSFVSAPDYLNKTSYALALTVTDGTDSTTQSITVTVTNVDDAEPVFSSSSSFSAAENQTAIGTVTATDADSSSITFTVSGSELAITSGGLLSFVSAPDYETKSSYTATVTATDGTNSTTQSITVTVTDVNESSVTVAADAASTNEDTSITFDPLTNDTIVTDGYSVSVAASSANNGAVTVNSGNTLTYTPSLNFFGTDTFTYTATVNSVSGSATVTVTVNSVNDLPIINSLNSILTPDENQTAVVTVSASDVETSSLTYSVSGTDSTLFSISSSGVLTFKTAPDYEAPADADTDNNYAITIAVGDGTDTVSQAVTVEVQNVADLVSGVAVDGYVAGATVFQDLDNDGVLDSGEPNTSTNALGSFSLTLSSVNKSAPVRIINGYDLATNEIHPSVMDISVTETGSYIITPISTLVGRLKIEDTTLTGTVPQSMIAAAMGISMADSPNDAILGFDPIAYFNGSDSTLATEARPVFAASQLLMAQGGGNYGVNKYITDQVLSTLSTTLTSASGSSITMSSASDIIAIKQDAYDAIFNGIVDTTLADNPPINNVQFKNNKAVMTDYLNGSASSQVQHSLYGIHDGTTTLVADLVGAKLDYENLKQIIDNDGTGKPLDLSFELSSLPIGSGTTSVNLRLFYGNDAVQDSGEDYLQVALTANWESDGTTLQVKLPASSNLVATFFDRSGTTLSTTVTNVSEDIITAAQSGPNRPQTLKVRLSTLFSAFPTEVSGLSSFLDGAATFTYQVEFGSFSLYDHLENSFTKIQGTFAVTSTPDIAVFADDIYVHENATTKDITFRLSQASSSNVTVDYAISGSSSASSSDYTLSAGTVTIPAGSMSTTLAIAVTNDTAVEAQEEIRLSLSNPQNAVLGRTTVSAYITDGEKILDNAAQKAILVNNIFKDSKSSINSYIKSSLDGTSVVISGTSYTYSQVLVNNSLTSDVYAYIDSIVDDYEVMAEAMISAIMTKSNAYVDSQLSGFSTYAGFAQALTQLNSGLKGLNVSQIVGTNISNDGTYPSGQSAATLLTAVEGKVNTLVTLAADTVADILGTDTNANFPNANVIIGTDGNDTITGTSGSDLIASFNGTDTVNGAAGNDKILGGSGVDTINGGDNNDHIYGYAGADILSGDADADKILGGLDNDTIRGGAGNDDLRGEAGDDTIYTGAGTDTVTGGLGNDIIIIDGL